MVTMEHKSVGVAAAAHPAAMARLKIERDVISAMQKPGLLYWALVGFFGMIFAVFLLGAWGYQIYKGIGAGGQMNPVGWGIYIVNFVFWVGIAHSGTLISAVLFLFRSKFRSSFNRAAEAMTVIAVMCAGMYPIIHLGRAWYFFWLLPYPNQRLLWTNFKSPLEWDVFAVSTYLTISVVFFYVGLIPDFAIVKRYTKGFSRHVYSALSLGWVGTKRQWRNYNMLYTLLAGLAAPLVLSVHSVVSWDFAMGLVPGWHTTIFAPYFVAGAIFSGCAMVLTLCIPMRKLQRLEDVMPIEHFEKLAKTMLFTSMIVGYAYIIEFLLAYYSGNVYEFGIFKDRATGYYKWQYWGMVFCNMIVPLPLFIKKLRRNLKWLFITSIFVNIGMWLERFVIIITSLAKEFVPYAWGQYKPQPVEISIMIGTWGFFFMMFLLFAKFLPVVAITEKKEEVH
jgi:molybdopterin-containing oxidoreductase family membrane subunit